MKNRQITLVDLGLDASFDASMRFVQGTMESINAGMDQPIVDVHFVRSRDQEVIRAALTAPADVLHVMAHGDSSEDPAFVSSDFKTVISLASLAEDLLTSSWGMSSSVVIADGCSTVTGRWQRAVRDCLQGPITYIGTTKAIGWHEATTYCSAFYSALTRNKGKGRSVQQQGLEAAERSTVAYEGLLGVKCPFKAVELKPSRRAASAQANRDGAAV